MDLREKIVDTKLLNEFCYFEVRSELPRIIHYEGQNGNVYNIINSYIGIYSTGNIEFSSLSYLLFF